MSQAVLAEAGTNRDEPQLLAEALVVLQRQRLVMRDVVWAQRAAAALGITLDDVEDARERLLHGNFVPARRGWQAPVQRPPESRPAPLKRPPTRSRPQRDGQLWCSRHDGEKGVWLPEDSFGKRADRPGKRKPWCRDCTRAYSARKYLSTATILELQIGGVLVSSLPPGSPLVAGACPACREGFLPTDVVVMGLPSVFHECCLERDGLA